MTTGSTRLLNRLLTPTLLALAALAVTAVAAAMGMLELAMATAASLVAVSMAMAAQQLDRPPLESVCGRCRGT